MGIASPIPPNKKPIHPMLLRRLPLALFLASMVACGGSESGGAGAGDADGVGATETSDAPVEEVESILTVHAGGEDHPSAGRVRESGVKGGEKLHAVLMGDSNGSPTGEPSVTMGLTTGKRRTGTFELVFNPNKLREGKDLATVTCMYAGGGGTMTGLSGSLEIDTLETEPSGKAYRILRLVGSFEGKFRKQDGGEEEVSGSFDYTRD